MSRKLNIVILAAGKGTRMYSETPKVLHELAGRSLIEHVISTARNRVPEKIILVVGHQAEASERHLENQNLIFVYQTEQNGTAHALGQALTALDDDATTLVLYGDVPLTKTVSLEKLLMQTSPEKMAVLTCQVNNPHGLGRIIRDGNGQIEAIVEEKDADEKQKEISEINTGIMSFPVNKLKKWLPKIGNKNSQKEYYLTDIIELARLDGCEVQTVSCDNETEASGINNMLQLSLLEKAYQLGQAEKLMLQGVRISDPQRFDLRGEAEVATDVQIDINVILEGKVTLGKNVKIGANCILKNCQIMQGTEILPNTIIEDSVIGMHCHIGPFARIRPGTELKNNAKIGNFVETKKAQIGEGSKINHLSYIGDSKLGSSVNIGAGTITCNYDGINKSETKIGNNVFIGSNTALVAPVTIADGATVGAGSVITKDIETGQLALSRTKQSNIDGWKRPIKK